MRNRQRSRPIDLRLFRRIARHLLVEYFQASDYELSVFLVGAEEMTRVNEQYLQHAGSTDVITFDYGDPGEGSALCGDIFICVDEAILQARRFHATWQSEVVRYFVHALLHLRGFDDHKPADYRRMKHEENRLVKRVARECPIQSLGR